MTFEACMDTTTNPETSQTRNIFGEIEEIIDEVEERFDSFKNFDIIQYPPEDHRYLLYKKDCSRVLLGSSLGQKIEQEWNLLENNLPNSIFVRVYESRVDLMRVSIVGPPGTPYHHGLFFFDVLFPRNYPSSPPKVHYHSYDLEDLNPNLRRGGKVCLGMLETGYERMLHEWVCNTHEWNPRQSSILNVLYEIKGLIMWVEPCPINEINKRAFERTCGMVVEILRNPPMNFGDFVKGYFRKRAHPILLKFRQEFDGNKDEMIVELFTNLYRALEMNGTYCMHHLCFLKSIKENREEESTKKLKGNREEENILMKIAKEWQN